MEELTTGSVILVSFPFSNLKGNKVRPALVLARVEFNNVILCQITSKPYSSKSAMAINKDDFVRGGLPVISYVRPDKIFTADPAIIRRKVGELKLAKRRAIFQTVTKLFVEK